MNSDDPHLLMTANKVNEKSHHFGKAFCNPDITLPGKSLADLMKWRLEHSTPKTYPLPTEVPDLEFIRKNRSQRTITWIGHSTFLLQLNGVNILTDPQFSDRASPFSWAGPKRYTPLPFAKEKLPRIDIVLISHDHYDHLDLPSVTWLSQRQPDKPPVFLGPLGQVAWFKKNSIHSGIDFDWWQHYGHKGKLNFYCVPVQHWSSRSPFSQNRRLWCGWVIESCGKKIFFSGDLGFNKNYLVQMKNRLGAIDLSLLPIGAYEPRWFMKKQHIAPYEAVKIHNLLGSKLSIAMHWGTFLLTGEPIEEPPRLLRSAMQDLKVPDDHFLLLRHGQLVKL